MEYFNCIKCQKLVNILLANERFANCFCGMNYYISLFDYTTDPYLIATIQIDNFYITFYNDKISFQNITTYEKLTFPNFTTNPQDIIDKYLSPQTFI